MPLNEETISPSFVARLRKLAKRKGYIIHKSRRSISADNLGGYQIVEPNRNVVVAGSRYEYTPGDVEEWLNSEP